MILNKYHYYCALFVSVFSYLILGYFFERNQFSLLFVLFSLVFISTFILTKSSFSNNYLFKIGILFRVLFLFATPSLSQDFYRFIWDGNAILSGLNPYQFKPQTIINTFATFPNAAFLFEKMGSLSASHFSNYPPINQLFFTIAAYIGGKSLLISTAVLRLTIIFADLGIYYYGQKILTHFNKNKTNIFLYFLNPLVILELTGNLHFEGVMLFFVVLGLYHLITKKTIIASVFIAVSIAIKLLPILLLPLFYKYLGFKKSVPFYAIIVVLNLLFFLPFINPTLIHNYFETISLWFTNFEFNASFYYIVREIGYYWKGYNIIHIVGKITPIVTVLIILFYAFYKKNTTVEAIIIHSLLVLSLYLFISTTVHPWYIINLIALSVFTNHRFPIVWSFFIILSYFAYSTINFQENMFLIIVEYFAVFSVFIYEVFLKPSSIQNIND